MSDMHQVDRRHGRRAETASAVCFIVGSILVGVAALIDVLI